MTNWLQQIQSVLAKKGGEDKTGGSLSDMLAPGALGGLAGMLIASKSSRKLLTKYGGKALIIGGWYWRPTSPREHRKSHGTIEMLLDYDAAKRRVRYASPISRPQPRGRLKHRVIVRAIRDTRWLSEINDVSLEEWLEEVFRPGFYLGPAFREAQSARTPRSGSSRWLGGCDGAFALARAAPAVRRPEWWPSLPARCSGHEARGTEAGRAGLAPPRWARRLLRTVD